MYMYIGEYSIEHQLALVKFVARPLTLHLAFSYMIFRLKCRKSTCHYLRLNTIIIIEYVGKTCSYVLHSYSLFHNFYDLSETVVQTKC